MMLQYDVELTNVCNKHCSICPRDKLTRPMGYMNDAIFNRVRQITRGHDVFLTGFGEPTLHDKFVMFTKELHETVGRLSVTTNGTSPVSKLAYADRIFLSVHYLDSAAEILNKFLPLANKVTVVTVDSPLTDAKKIKAICTRIGLRCMRVQAHNRGNNLPDADTGSTGEDMRGQHCKVYSGITFIAWNGEVLPCCHDLTGIRLSDIRCCLPKKLDTVIWPICANCSDAGRH